MVEDVDLSNTRTVRSDGSVNIPDGVLEDAGLEPGDQVLVNEADGSVVVVPWDRVTLGSDE